MNFQDEFDELDEQEEDSPESISRGNIILWLVVIGLAILFVPLNLFFTTVQSDVVRLQNDMVSFEGEIANNSTPPADVQAMMDQVASSRGEISQIESIYPTLVSSHVDWPNAMDAISNYDLNQMLLTDITQSGKRLIITGKAINDTAVVAYAQALNDSNQFDNVEIQSITLIGAPIFTPTPEITSTGELTTTATISETESASNGGSGGSSNGGGGSGGTNGSSNGATSTPGSEGGSGSGSGTGATPTGTPIPDPRDEFEPDESQVPSIFLGQVQARNFYPNEDVDSAILLAKANRYYRVETQNLSPGVDTILEVNVNGILLTNDDGKVGTLGSEIIFQTGDQDINILIVIKNRGIYGADMNYQLLVEETFATLTPAPGNSPTPSPIPTSTGTLVSTQTPTPSPSPTSTPTPSPTPTFTPVPGDVYEPNDISPSFIGVGESQTHTFDPNGDIDMITFPAKSGRQYQVFSENLGFGVDTYLAVDLGSEVIENDDYAPPGNGNLASGICYNSVDGNSPIAIFTNLNDQYGADKQYDIVVKEVPALESNNDTLMYGPVIVGNPNPPTQTISLTSIEPITWSVNIDDSWVHVQPITNTTPSPVDIGVDITGLLPGLYESPVSFEWADFCEKTITVTLQVNAVSQLLEPEIVVDSFEHDDNGISRLNIAKRPFLQSEVSFIIVVDLKEDLPSTHE